jgi:hypothetical protein
LIDGRKITVRKAAEFIAQRPRWPLIKNSLKI